jgi:hypothetical protein
VSCVLRLHQLLNRAAPWLSGFLLCGMLAATLPASARQPTVSAETVQQQVQAIDARFKAQKPSLERPVDGVSAEGAHVEAWGAPKSIEKISLEALGERGKKFQDFYWKQGLLIAAREQRIDYGAYITELPKDKPTPMNVVADDWIEFAGQAVLRRRSLGREMPKDDADAREQATKLKADARSFRRLMAIPLTKANKIGNCVWSCARERHGECFAYSCK